MNFKISNIPGNSVYINYKAIKDRHGSGVLKLIRSLISQGKRITRHRAHLFFNHSCLRENILTKSLMIKSPINTRAGRKLAEKFGFNCLKLRINESHFWIRKSLQFMDNIREELLKNSVINFESILKHVEFTANKLYNTLIKHYKEKIAKLKQDFKQKYDEMKISNKKIINGNMRNKDNWVVNLSNKNLSEDERKVLSLGLNFAVSQDYIPKTEILANIEKGIKNLSDNTSSIIRSKVVDILNKKNKSIPNLSIKERKALKNLRNDTNIVITKADKGNCTVIIDKDKYEEKIFKLLNDKDTYVLIKNDLTKSIERKLNKFIFDLYKIDRLSQKEYFYLRSTDAIAPRIYGLPKIHKPDWPLRPIVSFINSPLYNLSKFMAKILTPLKIKSR